MKRTCLPIALIAALVASSSALAQTVATNGSDAPAKPKKEKRICRTVEITGSILGSSVCHTAAQWAAIGEQGRRNRDSIEQSAGAPGATQGTKHF